MWIYSGELDAEVSLRSEKSTERTIFWEGASHKLLRANFQTLASGQVCTKVFLKALGLVWTVISGLSNTLGSSLFCCTAHWLLLFYCQEKSHLLEGVKITKTQQEPSFTLHSSGRWFCTKRQLFPYTHSHQERFGVQCLPLGHFNIWIGIAREQASNPTLNDRSSLSPEQQLPHLINPVPPCR